MAKVDLPPRYDMAQAAQYLAISKRQLARIYKTEIAHYRIGGRVIFDQPDLDDYRRKHRHEVT